MCASDGTYWNEGIRYRLALPFLVLGFFWFFFLACFLSSSYHMSYPAASNSHPALSGDITCLEAFLHLLTGQSQSYLYCESKSELPQTSGIQFLSLLLILESSSYYLKGHSLATA